ncbi:MAG: glutathione S-transferase [Alphaproteobacteria bacterium]|nr:glutathione S-transferase [Alphaproteobacteria bacterium]
MYRLYWRENTGAFAVDVALSLAKAPATRIHVDTKSGENRTPRFLALNPLGQVPTLELPDGTVMTESAAMLLLVAERFPAAALAPTPADPARGQFLRLLLLLAVPVYETELHVSYPARYTADAAGADGVLRAARARQDQLFALLAAELGDKPFLLGDRAGIIDAYFAMLAKWYGGDAGRAALEAHRARLRTDRVVDEVWRRYFPDAT